MKQLYTELQEKGLKKEEIEAIPSKVAWGMVVSKKREMIAKELKRKHPKLWNKLSYVERNKWIKCEIDIPYLPVLNPKILK